ncbi:hypothetical protein F2Q69_00048048 [Brassica cretica]|uniref:Uncharacterized protein n=1 Tax=Brassica cretica TaxID=69181 RepID=A0A8S9PPI3_BRACR|nr:hypothetical protein F2Q69_00048048 [Brassica cretica]
MLTGVGSSCHISDLSSSVSCFLSFFFCCLCSVLLGGVTPWCLDGAVILLYEKLCGGNANHRTRARKGSLRSDRTRAPLGRYIATELEPKLGRYVATELEPKLGRYVATERSSARSLRSDRALLKHRYDISPCILVYPSMLSPEDRSETISRSPPF